MQPKNLIAIIILFMVSLQDVYGQENGFFEEVESVEIDTTENIETLYQNGFAAINRFREDSIHIWSRGLWMSKCEANNARYKEELEKLDKLCKRKRVNLKKLQKTNFRFIQWDFIQDTVMITLPDIDTMNYINEHGYVGLDTLCITDSHYLDNYKKLNRAIDRGLIKLMEKQHVVVLPTMVEVSDIGSRAVQKQAEMLLSRIKRQLNLLTNNGVPNIPSYEVYLQNEAKRDFENAADVVDYRQRVLKKLNSISR